MLSMYICTPFLQCLSLGIAIVTVMRKVVFLYKYASGTLNYQKKVRKATEKDNNTYNSEVHAYNA